MEWNGLRVYVRAQEMCTQGENPDNAKSESAKRFGQTYPDTIKATISITIDELRPLVDRLQSIYYNSRQTSILSTEAIFSEFMR